MGVHFYRKGGAMMAQKPFKDRNNGHLSIDPPKYLGAQAKAVWRKIVPFLESEVRTVLINDEPYFVGKDVATAIGYRNTKDAINKHVKPKYRRESRFVTPSGNQTMTVISEP